MEARDILRKMLDHETFKRGETHAALVGIANGEYPVEQVTALLTGLQMRGVTVDELLGFRDGILETGVSAKLDCDRYIDVVGTGGDQKTRSTFRRVPVSSLPEPDTKSQSTAITPRHPPVGPQMS